MDTSKSIRKLNSDDDTLMIEIGSNIFQSLMCRYKKVTRVTFLSVNYISLVHEIHNCCNE